MSPALNGSSAIQHFKGSKAIEICDRITFDFYTGLYIRAGGNGTAGTAMAVPVF